MLSPIEQDAFQQLFPHFVEGSSVSAGDENNVSSLGLFNRHDSIVKDTQAASNSQVVTQNNDATTALVAGIAGRL